MEDLNSDINRSADSSNLNNISNSTNGSMNNNSNNINNHVNNLQNIPTELENITTGKDISTAPNLVNFKERKRLQVKKACNNCRKHHTGCDEKRPCGRCTSRNLQSTCFDTPKFTSRRRDTPSSSQSPSSQSSLSSSTSIIPPSTPPSPTSSQVPLTIPPLSSFSKSLPSHPPSLSQSSNYSLVSSNGGSPLNTTLPPITSLQNKSLTPLTDKLPLHPSSPSHSNSSNSTINTDGRAKGSGLSGNILPHPLNYSLSIPTTPIICTPSTHFHLPPHSHIATASLPPKLPILPSSSPSLILPSSSSFPEFQFMNFNSDNAQNASSPTHSSANTPVQNSNSNNNTSVKDQKIKVTIKFQSSVQNFEVNSKSTYKELLEYATHHWRLDRNVYELRNKDGDVLVGTCNQSNSEIIYLYSSVPLASIAPHVHCHQNGCDSSIFTHSHSNLKNSNNHISILSPDNNSLESQNTSNNIIHNNINDSIKLNNGKAYKRSPTPPRNGDDTNDRTKTNNLCNCDVQHKSDCLETVILVAQNELKSLESAAP